MDDLTKLSLDEFLDRLAERSPTPGGGAVAANAGALACALARMVAAYSIGKKTEAPIRARVREISERLKRADELMRPLVTADAEVYARMTEAAKAANENPAARPAHYAAVVTAIGVPMQMAAVATTALAAMDDLKENASPYLLSDLGAAAVLAEAAARAAQYSVRVNLPELPDAEARRTLSANIDQTVEHCTQRRRSIERSVDRRLQVGADPGR